MRFALSRGMDNRPNVAVGVDFSTQSNIAVDHARSIARHLERGLLLVHVARQSDVSTPGWAATPAAADALAKLRGQEAEARRQVVEKLESLRRQLSDGMTVRSAMVDDFPDNGLCVAAVETDSDLMVVGSHGRTGVSWFLLGSVSLRVVRGCERDVLIARGEAPEQGYRRILVATDFSRSSERALNRAVELSSPDSEIDVVYFYGHDPDIGLADSGLSAVGVELDERILTDLRRAGQSFIGQRGQAGAPTIRFMAHPSRAKTGIIHRLDAQPYDLVALGSHGRRGFRRWAIGSVAEVVARRAPCSVLVAKGTDEKQPT